MDDRTKDTLPEDALTSRSPAARQPRARDKASYSVVRSMYNHLNREGSPICQPVGQLCSAF